MTAYAPLPPLPALDTLAHAGHPVLAAVAAQLSGPRPAIAFYDDSPYIPPTDPQEQS